MALPLYPQLKIELSDWFLEIVEGAARSELGPFADSPRFIQHEGTTHNYTTVQGDERSSDYQDMQVEAELRLSEVPSMDFASVLRLLIEKGRELGAQQARYHFGVLNEVIEETGNIVDGKGQPVTLDLLLETIEKLHISFDDAGNPRMPTIIVGPRMAPRFQEIMRKADSDENAKARLNEIMERKRVEWDEEQDRRKLVD